MSWFAPWRWKQQRNALAAENAHLREDLERRISHIYELREELRKIGVKAAEQMPIREMYDPLAEIFPEDYSFGTRFRIRLLPLGVEYVLAERHLMGERSKEAFIDHLSQRLGTEFAKVLTKAWIEQGGIKIV